MKLLSLEASANTVSVAVQNGEVRRYRELPSGAKSSSWLIPTLLELLQEAKLQLSDLNAIVYGHGPGAFTGLRTVCSVVQGLCFGQQKPLRAIGVDTLLELAQGALNQIGQTTPTKGVHSTSQSHLKLEKKSDCLCFLSVLDARMDEWYVAAYEWRSPPLKRSNSLSPTHWQRVVEPTLCSPGNLVASIKPPLNWQTGSIFISTNLDPSRLSERLSPFLDQFKMHVAQCNFVSPNALLCLDLAPQLIGSGEHNDAVLPVYVRNRVALTTQERKASFEKPA
jgi:tRNA threonylcarbamoyladenosine biosynthesis protein TsaB